MKKLFLAFFFFLFSLSVFSQQNEVKISLSVVLKDAPIVLHDTLYAVEEGNTVQLETLKFYISNFELFQNDKMVFAEQNSFHLIDISDAASLNFLFHPNHKISFNRIKFNLGIDSTTNVSGAMGGDLDPTKGMYWTWQSGYINFKMEGTCLNCQPPNKAFEFHLGGYQSPYNPLQTIELKTVSKSNLILQLNLHDFFSEVDLSKQKNIMSPCNDAVVLAAIIKKCFSVK